MKNIHILPTDKPSRLHLAYDKDYYLSVEPFIQLDTKNYKSFNIYITSDEEIKEGDWLIIIDDFETYVHEHKGDNLPTTYHKKITLTTDTKLIADGIQPIDDEFLEWFVKNPSCEEVEVDLVPVNEFGSEITVNGYGFDKFKYKIIIPKEERTIADMKCACIRFQANCFSGMCRNCGLPPKEEPKQLNLEDFGLPKIGTKEFNDLASGLFGGKPKQVCENCKIEISKYGCGCAKQEEPKQELERGITITHVGKQETLEEAADNSLYSTEYLNESERIIFKKGCVYGAKWQQEDMIDKLEMHILINEDDWNRNPQAQFRNFIEQFKKK